MTDATETTWAGTTAAQVVLAFDLDGPTDQPLVTGDIWHRPGLFGIGATGPHRAVPRILDVLRDHNVQATFFTPAWVVRTWPDLCRRVIEAGHEMAAHGDLHESFFGLDTTEQADILRRSQRTFANILGHEALGFRAPSGDITFETLDLLVEFGHIYSSSMRGGDRPYRHRRSQLIEIPAKSLFDDYAAFAYHRAPDFPEGLDRIAPYAPVFRSWMAEVDAAADEGFTVATIWHPEVIGTPGRTILMDEFIGLLVHRDDVCLMRADEVALSYEGSIG